MINSKISTLINSLVSEGNIKYGQFKLKSGQISDYYVNLRKLNPKTFSLISEIIKDLIENNANISEITMQKAIVGVPYGVWYLTGHIAGLTGLEAVPIRKEAKGYGEVLELDTDRSYILIEDVMSSGVSIVETIEKMSNVVITDIIVIVNRKQGGDEKLKKLYPHIRLHSLIDASQLIKRD